MAGTIIVDKIQLDVGQDTLRVFSNTGSTILSANTSGINAASLGYGTLPSGRLPTIPASNMPANSILQIVSTVKSDTFTMSGSTYTTVTGLTATITPTSVNSRILVLLNIVIGQAYYLVNGRLMRDSTPIAIGDQVTSRPRTTFAVNTYVANQTYEEYHYKPVGVTFLDSPATTSPTTYSVQLASYSTYTIAVNRSVNFQDSTTYDPVTISTITLMEIAG